jgi:hypothetical protein
MQTPTLWPERLLPTEQQQENSSVSSAPSVVKPHFFSFSVSFRVLPWFTAGVRLFVYFVVVTSFSVVAAWPLWVLPCFSVVELLF